MLYGNSRPIWLAEVHFSHCKTLVRQEFNGFGQLLGAITHHLINGLPLGHGMNHGALHIALLWKCWQHCTSTLSRCGVRLTDYVLHMGY